jgi:hypothetical protein
LVSGQGRATFLEESSNLESWVTFIFCLGTQNNAFIVVTVDLPSNTQFEYKYIRKNKGDITWESDPNRSSTTPDSGSCTIKDVWR